VQIASEIMGCSGFFNRVFPLASRNSVSQRNYSVSELYGFGRASVGGEGLLIDPAPYLAASPAPAASPLSGLTRYYLESSAPDIAGSDGRVTIRSWYTKVGEPKSTDNTNSRQSTLFPPSKSCVEGGGQRHQISQGVGAAIQRKHSRSVGSPARRPTVPETSDLSMVSTTFREWSLTSSRPTADSFPVPSRWG
jgi:hypothetical protein